MTTSPDHGLALPTETDLRSYCTSLSCKTGDWLGKVGLFSWKLQKNPNLSVGCCKHRGKPNECLSGLLFIQPEFNLWQQCISQSSCKKGQYGAASCSVCTLSPELPVRHGRGWENPLYVNAQFQCIVWVALSLSRLETSWLGPSGSVIPCSRTMSTWLTITASLCTFILLRALKRFISLQRDGGA